MKLPSSQSRPLWVVAGVVLCALIAFGVWRALRAEAPAAALASRPELVRSANRLFVPEDSPLRKRLAVAPVDESTSAHSVTLPAVVEADPASTVNILPPATGRVLTLKVRLGDTVRRGQELATLSSSDFAQAVADVQKARDALDLAQRALTRARGVNEAGSNAAKDVEAATSAVVQQTAELRRSEIRLRSLNEGNASTAAGPALLSVISPISGSVTAMSTAPGAVVNDATASLMTISNLEHVWLTANVPEALVGTVANGQDVSVALAAFPGQVFSGKIAFVATVLDADTRRAKARIAFANPQGLFKPNMYATARIAVPQRPQPQVPTSALIMINDSTSVFVEVDPWTFVRRNIELGSEDGNQVRVRSGLESGERVVVRGGVLLND
ncbi:efflux RND transporter periplasmic adaptor subunit [Variovorax sp. Sphag1AA]|uniref:efflux RND transporter periplasmic adaptor subunit n=1 Tax=Variovorax sp. Sphag1AA TaxID=2587027 RepID=UPI0018408C50|nr:efflux RND transporter periplasmic adaptor subunit [Variovorax sp. Sphag1AA]MBB3178047.1 cobalt-zinc-cadmium efflux system membrane fusion protein [Variovorax sp. Sphag1AA]